MENEIRKVSSRELDRVCEILAEVIAHMKSIGFTQWDEEYPTREILMRDIEYDCLYGVYHNGVLIGFAALNGHQSKEYEEIAWQFGEPYLVVHRLQVDPAYRGRHVAYDLMLFAETLAKDTGCKAIRLDTREDNTAANRLYEKLRYDKRGIVHFPRMMEYDFYCFEKEIL
jgi:ribosomal protein S18 acetylase RimI-like enzyme